jgi:hypothetical protein
MVKSLQENCFTFKNYFRTLDSFTNDPLYGVTSIDDVDKQTLNALLPLEFSYMSCELTKCLPSYLSFSKYNLSNKEVISKNLHEISDSPWPLPTYHGGNFMQEWSEEEEPNSKLVSSQITSPSELFDSEKDDTFNYTKFVILDPINNRKKLANVAKGAKGVYIFEVINSNNVYVGGSINLYNRVSSYFMPYILSKDNRRVIRFFNKHGFKNVKLTLLILSSSATWDQVIDLEQNCINLMSPNLNVDLVAGGYNGNRTPMTTESREILRKLRGTPIYIYDTVTKSLIYISYSKQWLYYTIGIHHITLKSCINNGNLYLNRFLLSLDLVSEYPYETILTLDELVLLIKKVKLEYKPDQPASKRVLALNIINPDLSKSYDSISDLSRNLQVDRGTVRNHLSGNSTGLYKKQWKFSVGS